MISSIIKNIKGYINKHNLKFLLDVFLFGLITIALHWLWWNVWWKLEILDFLHSWANLLAHWVYLGSSWVLDNVFSVQHTAKNETLYFSNGYIAVIESCSGLKQFYQLFFLLLIFPGPWKHKLWYIPSGVLLIFLVNIFRIVMLSFILLWKPDIWDLAHMWVLRPFYYVVIFGLWVVWVERFKEKRLKAKVEIKAKG